MDMTSDIVKFRTDKVWVRPVLAVLILAACIFGWISVRRQLGNMLAETTGPTEPGASEIADVASDLAPNDPVAIWLQATIIKQDFSPTASQRSQQLFEQTVRAAPYDYRWWIELGRSYEQSQEPDRAEAAFKYAVRLAPSYTFPRWQLGNFYLRQQRIDDAMAQLRLATVNNLVYREQVFALAWDYFDHDPAKIEALATDGADVTSSLALFYAARGQAEDALRVWDKLTPDEKALYPEIAKAIAQGLFDRRMFPFSLEFSKQIGIDPDADPENVTNGGFEKVLRNNDESHFDWKFAKNDGKLDFAADSLVKHSGSKSLRLSYKNYSKPDLLTASQLVVVQPLKPYSLTLWLRTEGLRSAGQPQIEIVNANNDTVIATSKPFPLGTNDWQQIEVDLRVPEGCNAIIIRTTRGYCGEGCILIGTTWYDDFELKRQ